MGAFQALLNGAAGTGRRAWKVSANLEPITLDDWLGLVDSVDQVWVKVERPNPHYGNRRKLRELVEDSNSQSISMTFKAQEGESVSLDEDILSEARQHVEAEYVG